MPRLGDVQPGYLGKLIASAHKTVHGLVDMRGYDWSAAPHNRKVRPTYYEGHILKVDFSNSKADEGFEVVGAVFEECIFDKSIWWLTVFYRCQFIRCSFSNCCLYNSTLKGRYYDCSFRGLSAKGEHFSFGWGSAYKNCAFESVNLRNIGEEIGVQFKGCKISGIFTNAIFRGRRYAIKQRFRTLADAFCTVYRPVAFIRCDLSGLKTHNVVFDKDIIFKDNNVGSQSFFA